MILILNGSPNKPSTTMKITNELIKHKTNVTIINAYEQQVKSCEDCKYCSKKIGCKFNDDMNKIYQLLEEADTLIISSPVYFGAFSDKLLSIINRFQCYFGQKFDLNNNDLPRFKHLITITSQGSERVEMFAGAKLTHDILVKLFEPEYHQIIQGTNNDVEEPLSQDEIVNLINETKKRLA